MWLTTYLYKMQRGLVSLSVFILLCECAFSVPVSDSSSVVVSTTESGKESGSSVEPDKFEVNPQIYSMHVSTNVSNRFATTLITSKVRNLKKSAAETTFSVILPENAFISQFEMEIGGKIYKAYVKEKQEAKQIYEQAVASGQSAAHVELSARDSKTFTVSVNLEPESKTIFRLIYEELLQRQIGQYELIINIHPGQTVQDLGVQVYINESRPLTFVRTPSLRTGNEISKNDEKLDPAADIEIINSTSATVNFNPDINKQKVFAKLLGKEKEDDGLAGQFVVQYDVERDPQGGEVLVRDGYFVHFFAPSELEPLQKHVVFVLDHSGSMGGRKIDQLIEAMQNILSELQVNDLFNIVRFAGEASVWNVTQDQFIGVNLNSPTYGNLEPHLKELNLPDAVQAIKENVEKAKNIIKDKADMGLTNIIAGLEIGQFLIKRTQENIPNKYQPMIIFLTDGLPNVGMHDANMIIETVTKLNSGANRASIFSLSFGSGADKNFLKKLSSQNLGFSRHIYEAADASLQLQDFYRKISSPLLSNVTFKYVDGVTDVTKTHYPILFRGSELVVAGKADNNPDILLHVYGRCGTGRVKFNATRTEPVSSLERLWAYLTVKQLLSETETGTNTTELTKKALDLSLKYSFVTSVSSLVVVKPNKTDAVESRKVEDSDLDSSAHRSSGFQPHHIYLARSGPRGAAYGPPSSPTRFLAFGGASSRRYHIANSYSSAHSSSGFQPLHRMPFETRPPLNKFLLSSNPAPAYPGIVSTTRRAPLQPRPSSVPKNSTIPDWLENMRRNNENVTTSQGSFILGRSGDVTTRPECPKSPLNGTGECTVIFDCPEVYQILTDITVYLQYFCPLNQYAGVCCPTRKSTTPIP